MARRPVAPGHPRARRAPAATVRRARRAAYRYAVFNNVFNNIAIPVVILGPDLRIRRFTPQAETVMNLIAADVGRPLTDIKLNIDLPDLQQLIFGGGS